MKRLVLTLGLLLGVACEAPADDGSIYLPAVGGPNEGRFPRQSEVDAQKAAEAAEEQAKLAEEALRDAEAAAAARRAAEKVDQSPSQLRRQPDDRREKTSDDPSKQRHSWGRKAEEDEPQYRTREASGSGVGDFAECGGLPCRRNDCSGFDPCGHLRPKRKTHFHATFMSSEEENWRIARVLITEEDGAKTLALVQRTGGYGATDPPSGTQVQYACLGKYDDEQGVPNYFDCFERSPSERDVGAFEVQP